MPTALFRCMPAAMIALAAATSVATPPATQGNPSQLMMPDSTNNRIVLFNLADGSVADADYFTLQGGTPIHAMQVGYEVWVSEQSGDRVGRWSLDGAYLGAIGGGATDGLDNVRGMSFGSGEILLSNGGAGNGAPGPAIVRISFDGAIDGTVVIGSVSPSPFAILQIGTGYLVASTSANDDIHRLNLQLEPVGTFHNSTQLNFAEQMVRLDGGDVLVAGFSSNNLVRLDSNGTVVSTIAAVSPRGVAVLGNGNILWTNSAGAHVHDVTTQTSTQVYTGGGRFLDYFQFAIEPPIFADGFDPPPLAH